MARHIKKKLKKLKPILSEFSCNLNVKFMHLNKFINQELKSHYL